VNGPGGLSEFPSPNAQPMDTASSEAATVLEVQDFGCLIECPPSPSCPGAPGSTTRIVCAEAPSLVAKDSEEWAATAAGDPSPLSAILRVDVPEGATYFWFDFDFVGRGDGDYAAVLLGGETVWVMSGESILQEGTVSTAGPIPVGDLEGEQVLEVALYGTGAANASVEVDNLRFSFEQTKRVFSDDFEVGTIERWSSSTAP